MNAPRGWTFRWHVGHDAIFDREFATLWQQCVDADACANVFQEPKISLAWIASKGLAIRATPAFCVGEGPAGALVVVPFCEMPCGWRQTYQRRLIGVGQPHFDYQHPAGVPEEDAGEFWTALESELSRTGSYEAAMLCRMAEEHAPQNSQADEGTSSPYISLGAVDCWDAFLSGCGVNHRSDVRRRIRRIREHGNVELVVLRAADESVATRELALMREAYERLWLNTPSADLFQQPGTFHFYQELLSNHLLDSLVHFSVLRLNGQSIAWHFGFLHRKVLHWYKPTYDVEFRDLSPGKVLLAELVQLGISSNWREIDLGCGTEPYKYDWTSSERKLRKWYWNAKTLRGAACRWVRLLAGRRSHFN